MKHFIYNLILSHLSIVGMLTTLSVLSTIGCSAPNSETQTMVNPMASMGSEQAGITSSPQADQQLEENRQASEVSPIKSESHVTSVSFESKQQSDTQAKDDATELIDLSKPESETEKGEREDDGKTSSSPEQRGLRYAVLVGVSEYPGSFPALPGAQRDMSELAKVLISKGFDKSRVTLITNQVGQQDARRLPLAHNIRKRLRKLASACGPDDALIVAMAGHGVQPKGSKYTFCPYDADLQDPETLISIEEVYQLLSKSKAKFKLLMIDACRQETELGNSSVNSSVSSETMPGLPAPPQGMATFVSCSQGQLAYERQDGELSHGVFFHAVIAGLSGAATADDGAITVPDLERYVKKKVESYVRQTYQAEQIPVLRNNTAGLYSIVKYTRNDKQIEKFRWCLARDRYLEAREILNRVLAASPDDGVALAERSRLTTYVAEQQGDLSHVSSALADAKRSLELAPHDAMPYVAMANVHRLNKEYEQSLAMCTKALKQDPNSIQAHIIKGMTLYAMSDFKAMFKEAQTALEIDPTHPEARGLLAAFQFADGQFEAGQAELDRAIALMPDLPTLYFLKGYGFEQRGEHHKAVLQYSSAIRLNDQVPSYFVRRALSLGSSGDYPAAWKDVAAAEELAPTYFDVTSARAMLLVNQQKWEEALVALDKGLKINPDSPDLLMGRGFANIYTQRFAQGEADLQKMIAIKPEASQGHLGLGVIDFYQNRLPDAMTHLQRAIRYDDRSSEAHYISAAIHMKRRQFQQAIKPLSRAIELDPKNAIYYQQRAMIYQMLGRAAEAQSDNMLYQKLK